jgi:uncharacterized protein YuzE
MKFTFDPRYNIAYIRLHEKTSEVETVRVSDELLIDMAPDGAIFGIEFLNANEQIQGEEMGKLLFINEATGEQKELFLSINHSQS